MLVNIKLTIMNHKTHMWHIIVSKQQKTSAYFILHFYTYTYRYIDTYIYIPKGISLFPKCHPVFSYFVNRRNQRLGIGRTRRKNTKARGTTMERAQKTQASSMSQCICSFLPLLSNVLPMSYARTGTPVFPQFWSH